MNALVALLLKDRISQFTYVDKLAGMVRAITRERAGGTMTIPVDIAVDAPLACPDEEISDLVPNEGYGCIVYFEDKGLRRIQSRTRGVSFESRLRLVCWVNTAKFSGDNYAADRIMEQFIVALQDVPTNEGPFIGVRHQVESVPERGKGLFGAYTYPESSAQYLLYPFDAFAIDIVTALRIRPGCEDQVTPGGVECWTPPTNRRRRFPREFSCEELTDAENGLTAEQLGPGCLDCEGGTGPCADATVTRDGLPFGTVAAGGSINVPSNCDPCPPASCSDPANVAIVEDTQGHAHGGTYKPTGTVNGKDEYTSAQDANRTLYYTGTNWRLEQTGGGGHSHDAAAGNEDYPSDADWSGTGITVTQGTIADLCCDESGGGDVRIRNAADNATIDTVTAPDDWIIPPIRIPYVDADGNPQYFIVYIDGITEGELTVTEPGGGVPPVPRFAVRTTDAGTVVGYCDIMGPALNLPQSRIKYKDADDASEVSAPHNTVFEDGTLRPDYEVPRRELVLTGGTGLGRYVSVGDLIGNTVPTIPQRIIITWEAGMADSIGVVLPAEMQGVAFSFVSETVSHGTITVSVNNGGSFAAAPFTPGTQKVIFRRTTTTNEGSALFTTA